MTTWNDVKDDPLSVKVLDHGFVRLVDVMGDDASLAEAARTSYGAGTKTVNDNTGLIRYLFNHYHTSPIEMAELKFHLKMPIFVMRQHVRHRTANLNEYSGRYSVMSDEFYVPELSRFQGQSSTNNQGSSGLPDNLDAGGIESLREDLISTYCKTYSSYKYAIDSGLSREIARIQLPVSNYTELYWKIDLKNFFGYMRQRDESHAQYEIREYARAMYELIKPCFPISCKAYDDYWNPNNTCSLSRMELNLLKAILSDESILLLTNEELMKKFELSKRELSEFMGKCFSKDL